MRCGRTDRPHRGERTSERTYGPEDQRPVPCSRDSTGRLAGQPGALGVYLAYPLLEVVVLQLETVGGESVGLYGVSACPQILHVDIRDHLRVGEVRAGVGMADAPLPEQLSQVAAQGKDLSPFGHTFARRREAASTLSPHLPECPPRELAPVTGLAPRRLPRLLKARPSAALDERHGPLLGPVTEQLQHDSPGISIRRVYLAGAVRL